MVEPISYKREVYRKITHMLLAFFAFALMIWDKAILVPIFVLIAVVYFLLDLIRQKNLRASHVFSRFFGYVIRNEEATRFTGAANAFTGIAIVSFIFDPGAAIPAILIVSLSDALAAIIGRKYGRTKIGKKSLEGSAAFFLCTYIILTACKFLNTSEILALTMILTLFELFPIKNINDNLTIPIISALLISMIRNLL